LITTRPWTRRDSSSPSCSTLPNFPVLTAPALGGVLRCDCHCRCVVSVIAWPERRPLAPRPWTQGMWYVDAWEVLVAVRTTRSFASQKYCRYTWHCHTHTRAGADDGIQPMLLGRPQTTEVGRRFGDPALHGEGNAGCKGGVNLASALRPADTNGCGAVMTVSRRAYSPNPCSSSHLHTPPKRFVPPRHKQGGLPVLDVNIWHGPDPRGIMDKVNPSTPTSDRADSASAPAPAPRTSPP
jgi:hypothetical protein